MTTISMSKSDAQFLFNLLGGILKDTSGPSGVKLNKSGKPKKQNSNKGKPTCHGDFVKMICEKMKDEVVAFKAENPDQKGAHLVFAANYKKANPEVFATFETQWKEAHPKDAVSETTSVAEDAEVASDASGSAATGTEKPKRTMSDEQKAKMKAGREAAKAKKDAEKAGTAPAPVAVTTPADASIPEAKKKPVKSAKKATPAITTAVVAPIENTTVAELLPFSFNGATYLRLGSKLPNGDALYTSGHLWMSGKKGAKGPHYGELKDDGTIDMEAEEPTA